VDEHGYPHLPDNVMDLRLGKKKGILREFMGAARCRFDIIFTTYS